MNAIRIFSFLMLVIVVTALPGCEWGCCGGCQKKQSQSTEVAPVAQATDGLFVINVLEKELYDDCHIKGSISVQLEDLEKFAAPLNKEKAEIVVYCSNYSCTASGYAAKKLVELGFKYVWAYEGGMAEWIQLGLPVEGPCASHYLLQEVAKPACEECGTTDVITAQELDRKIKQASDKVAA